MNYKYKSPKFFKYIYKIGGIIMIFLIIYSYEINLYNGGNKEDNTLGFTLLNIAFISLWLFLSEVKVSEDGVCYKEFFRERHVDWSKIGLIYQPRLFHIKLGIIITNDNNIIKKN